MSLTTVIPASQLTLERECPQLSGNVLIFQIRHCVCGFSEVCLVHRLSLRLLHWSHLFVDIVICLFSSSKVRQFGSKPKQYQQLGKRRKWRNGREWGSVLEITDKGLPNSSDVGVRIKIIPPGTSLVVQWLRICLPMQDIRVRCLVRKIPHTVEQLSPCNQNH